MASFKSPTSPKQQDFPFRHTHVHIHPRPSTARSRRSGRSDGRRPATAAAFARGLGSFSPTHTYTHPALPSSSPLPLSLPYFPPRAPSRTGQSQRIRQSQQRTGGTGPDSPSPLRSARRPPSPIGAVGPDRSWSRATGGREPIGRRAGRTDGSGSVRFSIPSGGSNGGSFIALPNWLPEAARASIICLRDSLLLLDLRIIYFKFQVLLFSG